MGLALVVVPVVGLALVVVPVVGLALVVVPVVGLAPVRLVAGPAALAPEGRLRSWIRLRSSLVVVAEVGPPVAAVPAGLVRDPVAAVASLFPSPVAEAEVEVPYR